MCIRDRPSSEDYHFLISRPYSADTSGLYAVYIPLNADGLPAADLTAEDMKLIPVENQKTLDVTMEGAEGNRSYALMFVNNDQYTCLLYTSVLLDKWESAGSISAPGLLVFSLYDQPVQRL